MRTARRRRSGRAAPARRAAWRRTRRRDHQVQDADGLQDVPHRRSAWIDDVHGLSSSTTRCEPRIAWRRSPSGARFPAGERFLSGECEAKRSAAHLVAVHLRIGGAVVTGHRLGSRRASAIEPVSFSSLTGLSNSLLRSSTSMDMALSAGQPPCSIYHRLNPSQAAVPAPRRPRPAAADRAPTHAEAAAPVAWRRARELRLYLRIRARGWHHARLAPGYGLGGAARLPGHASRAGGLRLRNAPAPFKWRPSGLALARQS